MSGSSFLPLSNHDLHIQLDDIHHPPSVMTVWCLDPPWVPFQSQVLQFAIFPSTGGHLVALQSWHSLL